MDDPTLWKQISGWMWTLLAVPLRMLWLKADGAASKQELKDAVDDMKESIEKASELSRENTKTLFANAEGDRRRYDDRFSQMQDTLHGIHVDVLKNLEAKK